MKHVARCRNRCNTAKALLFKSPRARAESAGAGARHTSPSAGYRGLGPRSNKLEHDLRCRRQIIAGRVLDVDDIISFHGESVAGFEANFHAVIDGYVSACEQPGTAPEKPASGKLIMDSRLLRG